MPLLKGKSKHIISSNIRELMHSGKKQDQAIGIAYKTAGMGRKRDKKPHAPHPGHERCK